MKYLNLDSIKAGRDNCKVCAQIAAFVSLPYLLIGLIVIQLY